jgi:ferritin-like metal-binding protein YciE
MVWRKDAPHEECRPTRAGATLMPGSGTWTGRRVPPADFVADTAFDTGGHTMPALSTLHDLMVHQLKDLYSAERQLVQALPKMAKGANAPELQVAIQNHLEQTKGHVARLEQVFEVLGETSRGPACKGMQGLIEEAEGLLDEEQVDPDVLDAGIIADAQRVEHYEIAAYGTACEFARSMKHERVVSLLQETLDEEKEADRLLTSLAEGGINALAMRDGLEAMGTTRISGS